MPQLTINGKTTSVDADAYTPLLRALRDSLNLTGTKRPQRASCPSRRYKARALRRSRAGLLEGARAAPRPMP